MSTYIMVQEFQVQLVLSITHSFVSATCFLHKISTSYCSNFLDEWAHLEFWGVLWAPVIKWLPFAIGA